MTARPHRGEIVRGLGIVFVAGLCLLPLLWTLLASLGLQPVRLALQGQLTFDNYAQVSIFEPAFETEFAYTLAATFTATLLTVAVAFPAAYLLTRTRSIGLDGLMQGLLVLAVSPVVAYGLPLADLERVVGLYGSFAGLVFGCAAAQLPLALWLLRSYLVRLPTNIAEAARLDGASWWTVLWRIVLPMASGGLIATGVLVFVLDWNLFLLPSLLTEHPPMVLNMAMRDFFAFERELDWPTAAAVVLVTLAPVLVVVFGAQRALETIVLVPKESSE